MSGLWCQADVVLKVGLKVWAPYTVDSINTCLNNVESVNTLLFSGGKSLGLSVPRFLHCKIGKETVPAPQTCSGAAVG